MISPPGMGNSLGACSRRRKRLLKETGGKCEWCGERCDPKALLNTPLYFTTDHVLPRHLGGTNERSNLKGSCYACNELRNHIEWKIKAGLSRDHLKTRDPVRYRFVAPSVWKYM